MSAAEGRLHASCTHGTRTSPYIALPLGLGCLAPYAEPSADEDEGRPEGAREGSRASTRRDKDCPFEGPAEARKASEGTRQGDGAGADGFTPPIPGLRRFAAS